MHCERVSLGNNQIVPPRMATDGAEDVLNCPCSCSPFNAGNAIWTWLYPTRCERATGSVTVSFRSQVAVIFHYLSNTFEDGGAGDQEGDEDFINRGAPRTADVPKGGTFHLVFMDAPSEGETIDGGSVKRAQEYIVVIVRHDGEERVTPSLGADLK